MPAAYDNYDYPSYWQGREYEHESEIIALKQFLNDIKKTNRILDIGAGYGRLVPFYIYRANKVILVDPSAKHLKIASKLPEQKKIRLIQSKLENLGPKIKRKSIDLIIMVRVTHHVENLDKAVSMLSKLCKRNGHLIIEFPNKNHLKAIFNQIVKGNIIFPFDIFPKDLRTKKSVKNKTLPFVNYHPDFIKDALKLHGFKIIQRRSVSNVRSAFFKKIFPLTLLLFTEKYLQIILSYMNFGPSIFILAKKVK